MAENQTGNKDLIKEALAQFRSARKKIATDHPDLFSKLEKIAQKKQREEEIRQRAHMASPDHFHRQKNIETVQKVLAMKEEGDVIRKSIQALLNKTLS